MKNKILVQIFLATGFLQAYSQENAPPAATLPAIATDRPDQTETASLVPKGCFQVETGFAIEKDKGRIGSFTVENTNTTYNTTLFRYAVADNFEFRLITEFNEELVKVAGAEDEVKGMSPIAIGSKIAICEEKGIRPKISLNTHIALPYFGHEDFRPENITPDFRFLFQHTLSDRLAFAYNLGIEWENAVASGAYTASLAIALADKVGMFVEAYGFLPEKQVADHRMDAGFTFLPLNNLQFDLSGGFGLNEIAPDYFVSCGVSFRLPK
jgi:hypothetical protein